MKILLILAGVLLLVAVVVWAKRSTSKDRSVAGDATQDAGVGSVGSPSSSKRSNTDNDSDSSRASDHDSGDGGGDGGSD